MLGLFKIKGGVHPDAQKGQTADKPIIDFPVPSTLYIPLVQRPGDRAEPLVAVGDAVVAGQMLAAPEHNKTVAVHAPVAAQVVSIEPRVLAHPSGCDVLHVVLETTSAASCEVKTSAPDWKEWPIEDVWQYLARCGISGLGGAVFPTHVKLSGAHQKIRAVVINGVECEPCITCDDALMQHHSEEVLKSAALLKTLLGASSSIVAVEDNKPAALAALRQAQSSLKVENVDIVAVPTIYPAGDAKQLLYALFGNESAKTQRSTDDGVQCFNVATAVAVQQALQQGNALMSRIVTIGGAVKRPGNYVIAIGTPIQAVLAWVEPLAKNYRVIMGGPMMGFELPTTSAAVVKATSCLLVQLIEETALIQEEMPCIRCGECARSCPVDLQPHELYWFSRSQQLEQAERYSLLDCIECGCCSYVCPSHISLVSYFRYAKSELKSKHREEAQASAARDRYEWRKQRLALEKKEKAERMAKKASRLASGGAKADKKAEVQAALARLKSQEATKVEGDAKS